MCNFPVRHHRWYESKAWRHIHARLQSLVAATAGRKTSNWCRSTVYTRLTLRRLIFGMDCYIQRCWHINSVHSDCDVCANCDVIIWPIHVSFTAGVRRRLACTWPIGHQRLIPTRSWRTKPIIVVSSSATCSSKRRPAPHRCRTCARHRQSVCVSGVCFRRQRRRSDVIAFTKSCKIKWLE